MSGWEDLPGQGRNVRFLTASVQHGRVAHAYVFSGPEGVGKRTAALLLAQALNCPTAKEGLPCGECSSCRKIREGSHPDVQIIVPQDGSLKIEQIRQLKQAVALKPYEGRWKVFILEGAETLTDQAANSLLKVLEEPPSFSVLVLLAKEAEQLLPTILSRCVVLRFHPLPVAQVAGLLEEKYGVPKERAWLLAGISGGALGQALAMREDVESLGQKVESFLAGGGKGDWLAVLSTVKELEEASPEERELFLRLLEYTLEGLLSPETSRQVLWPGKVTPSAAGAAEMLTAVARARQLLAGNVLPRYVFEGLALLWQRFLQGSEIPRTWRENWLGVKEQA